MLNRMMRMPKYELPDINGNGGSVQPIEALHKPLTPEEHNGIHARVHDSALAWYAENILQGDALGNAQEEIAQAAACIGKGSFVVLTGREEPEDQEQDEALKITQSLVLIGALMYQAIAQGNLVFDGKAE